jgi:hypothetical protein
MPWKLKNAKAVDIAPDWLQPYCTQFLRKLSDQGYAAVTLRSYDAAAAMLCDEVSRRGLRSDQLVGATLTKARAAALGRLHPNRYDQKKYCPVMAAPLATELGLGADDLGLLTSVYFVTFAAEAARVGTPAGWTMLMANSTFTDSWTGRSAGYLTLRRSPT